MVIEAEKGEKGLQLLTEDTDLVILDIMMPGMSGLRTCKEIRKVSRVPVLFLTAKAKESDKLIGLMAGGDELACLARGLNSMRKSLSEQMNQKEQLVQANSRMITELSHEIRTPLTSLIIYTEILRSNKTADWRRALHYIDKIADRAKRIQDLADHIVQYASGDVMEYSSREDEFYHRSHDE